MSKINPRDNYGIKLDGTKLIIEIETDPAKLEHVMTSTGKNVMVATTGAFQSVGKVKFSLNVIAAP